MIERQMDVQLFCLYIIIVIVIVFIHLFLLIYLFRQQTESYQFKGSWPDNFVASPTLLPPYVVKTNITNKEGSANHNMSRCLGCMYSSWVGTGRDRSRSSSHAIDGEWNRLTPVIEVKVILFLLSDDQMVF